MTNWALKRPETSRIQHFKGAFSLLELLVVLMIIGLVSSLVAPHLVNSFRSININTAAKKLLASCRYARSLAVTEQKTYALTLDKDQNLVRLAKFVPEYMGWRLEGEADMGSEAERPDKLKIYNLPAGVRFEGIYNWQEEEMESLFQIKFYPRGNSNGGKFKITDAYQRMYTIEVDPVTGLAKLSEGR